MPFDSGDPRSRLTAGSQAGPVGFAPAQFFDFSSMPPVRSPHGSRTWWTRGQNFIVSHTMGLSGEVLRRVHNVDEYAVIFPGSAGAVIRSGFAREEIDSASVVFLPAGDSEIVLTEDAEVIRLFTSRNRDLLDLPVNGSAYETPDLRVTPLPDVETTDAEATVRIYRIADYPSSTERFARIFTSSTFMINFFDPDLTPRDVARLSPHHHDDFEQCSIATRGHYVHHIRYPWTTDRREWRDDEHVTVGSPSVAVIPPPAIHTSQSISEAGNQLIDVFCPPRQDFAAQPGWVINALDYAGGGGGS